MSVGVNTTKAGNNCYTKNMAALGSINLLPKSDFEASFWEILK